MSLNNKNMNKFKLYAPNEYWKSSKEEKDKITDGCGTSGWKGALVPETLWFLDVSQSCNIHDWMYHFGTTHDDKKEADRVFLNNMNRTINSKKSYWIIKKLRRNRARIYFSAVKYFGGDAFWENKNKPEEFILVDKISDFD